MSEDRQWVELDPTNGAGAGKPEGAPQDAAKDVSKDAPGGDTEKGAAGTGDRDIANGA